MFTSVNFYLKNTATFAFNFIFKYKCYLNKNFLKKNLNLQV